MAVGFFGKLLFKGKVSPTIKSIKPTTKTMAGSVKDTKLKQTVKNIDLVNKLKNPDIIFFLRS